MTSAYRDGQVSISFIVNKVFRVAYSVLGVICTEICVWLW